MGRRPRERKPLHQLKVLTTGQVAEVFGVAPRTVSNWHRHKLLPGYVIPGSLDRRFKVNDVRAFAIKNGVPTGALGDPDTFTVAALGVVAPTNCWPKDGPELRWRNAVDSFSLGLLLATRPDVDALVYCSTFGYDVAAKVTAQMPCIPAVVVLPEDGSHSRIDWQGIGYGLAVHRPVAYADVLQWVRDQRS